MPTTPIVSRSVEEPPKGARARQRAETRERIFQAALREFREVGFTAAQVDRIARAAGVVRGTFYFHFPTKDDVLLELARRISVRVARRMAALRETAPSLRELLLRVNDAIMDEHGRVGESGLLADMLALYTRRPSDLDLEHEETPTLAGELAHHLRRLERSGELSAGAARRSARDRHHVVPLRRLHADPARRGAPPGLRWPDRSAGSGHAARVMRWSELAPWGMPTEGSGLEFECR